MTPPFRIYWQPGCTSCLRAKEFLASRGIPFESINVRERPAALDELAARGIRAVPVIARGEDYVLGQDLDELAAFVGVQASRERLAVPVLVGRLDRLLAVAAAAVRALPQESWGRRIPQRERTYLDLGYHVAMVSDAFVDAAAGAGLAFERYERRVPPGADSAPAVAAVIEAARGRLAGFAALRPIDPGRELQTYFGARALHVVLERTAWHVAQHCRQLDHIAIRELGASPDERLEPADLEGLPVPEAVWDREITDRAGADVRAAAPAGS